MKIKSLPQPPQQPLQQMGWDWLLGTDTLPYLTDQLISVSQAEAQAYYDAVNDLYELFVEAGQYVIDHGLLDEMGIPGNLHALITQSWNDDRHLHLYGRFDLAGGIENQPVRLIEFNADTATCLPETAIVQWAHLQSNGLQDASQFNTVFESLVENFETLRSLNADLPPTLLLTAMRGFPEDDANVQVLGEAAREAGFDVEYAYLDEVEFSPSEGIFRQNPETGHFEQFHFWFKLVPWETIAADEPELADLLTQIVSKRLAVVINPAYALLFQSKALLKILWQLHPNHPLLLETQAEPLKTGESVSKVLFGREGANTRIVGPTGQARTETEGEYDNQPRVFQAYVPFPTDAEGRRYQAGVFFIGEGAGLGFRRGGEILDNTAQFCGHIVE